MAQKARDSRLEKRSNRLKLKLGERHFKILDTGVALCYRRTSESYGTWSVRLVLANGRYRLEALGTADDHIEANGQTVLSNFDIYAVSGAINQALDVALPVTVTGGQIQIQFVGVVYNTRIAAIEILAGAQPAPTVSGITPGSGAAGTNVPAELKIDGHSFLPQIRGEKGLPREWIYSWYSRKGGPTANQEWTRNQRYKLHATGDFFDISKDVLEQNPITDPSPEEIQIRDSLRQALDQFKDARPPALAKPATNAGEKENQ